MGGMSDFGVSAAQMADFQTAVWDHYSLHRRDLPWRHTRDAYEILVSEVMLQQTQVARVLQKYQPFLRSFPTVEALGAAAVGEVLTSWSELGYNRRASWLHEMARIVVYRHQGRVPASADALLLLPGVGRATAAAVCVFAFDQPQVFIETNIRSAFIHFFFPGPERVADADILPLVEATLDQRRPRDWYYALMDYGAWVKKTDNNPSRRSRHYAVQAPFAGSRRELRAQVLKALLAVAPSALEPAAVGDQVSGDRPTTAVLADVLEQLAAEGFLAAEGNRYRIA